MNIIELAKQAGFTANDEQEVFLRVYREEIERFAALVRKQALEEAAGVCDRGAEQLLHAYKREGAARCAAAIRAMKESGND